MARLARVMVADVAYHVTQRGNGRQYLLAADAERTVYLELLRQGGRRVSSMIGTGQGETEIPLHSRD